MLNKFDSISLVLNYAMRSWNYSLEIAINRQNKKKIHFSDMISVIVVHLLQYIWNIFKKNSMWFIVCVITDSIFTRIIKFVEHKSRCFCCGFIWILFFFFDELFPSQIS